MSQGATTYDLSRYYHGERPEMMTFVPKTARKILEIGCGEGHFSAALAQDRSCETWGIELSASAAAEASKRLSHVLQGDLFEQLCHIPKNSFDCIIMNDVLEHLPDSDRAIRDIKSLLAPGGTLVLSVPNVRHFSTMYRYLVGRDWTYEEAGVLDRTHLRFFTEKSLIKILDQHGFAKVNVKLINEDRALKVKILQWLALGMLRDVSYLQIAAVCSLAGK